VSEQYSYSMKVRLCPWCRGPAGYALSCAMCSNDNRTGNGLAARASGSNPADVGSTPTSPATYVNADTLEPVTEDWWPEVTHGMQVRRTPGEDGAVGSGSPEAVQ
jgi:hypothetical protein